MLLDSLFVALVNYLEYYYAIIICLFTKIFPARGSKASTLLNGENSYLIRWINSFSLLLRDWSIQMKHYMTYYCWCIIPKTFWCNCRVLYGLSQAFGKKLGRGGDKSRNYQINTWNFYFLKFYYKKNKLSKIYKQNKS